MTLAEAEQAVIRAAIELRDRLYSPDVDHDDHGEQLGNVCLTVDTLLALRLAPDMCRCGHVRSLHNQERGYPEFCPDPCPCQLFEPVPEQAKAEEP